MHDNLDYVACDTAPLLSQHFSAIAAAGPIVGPILAGVAFGWVPALIWILVGSIFIGGVHDFSALVASIRHRASSIIEVVRIHISGRAYLLFLAFVWLALVYIVVAFTDITATMFVGALDLTSGKPYPSIADAQADPNAKMLVQSGGVATSSLIYLVLPMIMGLLVKSGKLSMTAATWVFLPLVVLAILIGPYIPLNVDQVVQRMYPDLTNAQAALYASSHLGRVLIELLCDRFGDADVVAVAAARTTRRLLSLRSSRCRCARHHARRPIDSATAVQRLGRSS